MIREGKEDDSEVASKSFFFYPTARLYPVCKFLEETGDKLLNYSYGFVLDWIRICL